MIQKLPPELIREHKGISFTGIVVVFFCYDQGGRIFMAKRSAKARDEQHRWDVGGGGLKWGEAPEDTLNRELSEEYGTRPLQVDFLGYRTNIRKLIDSTPTHWLTLDYAVKVDPETVQITEPDMFEDSGWFTLDRLPAPLHSQEQIALNLHADKLKHLLSAHPPA